MLKRGVYFLVRMVGVIVGLLDNSAVAQEAQAGKKEEAKPAVKAKVPPKNVMPPTFEVVSYGPLERQKIDLS